MADNTQVSLRLTPDVYKMLKDKTAETGRSLNAEVIQAIIEHCDPNGVIVRLEQLEKFMADFKSFGTLVDEDPILRDKFLRLTRQPTAE